MVSVSKLIGFVALLIATAGAPLIVLAEDVQSPKGVVVSLSYSKGEFSRKFVEFVVKYGARTPEVYSAGKPLQAYVTEVCGSASATNERLFTLAIEYDGGTVADDGTIHPSGNAADLMLPSCLPSPVVERTPRIAFQYATFYKYFETDDAGADLFGSDVLAQTSLPQLLEKIPSLNTTPLALPPLSIDPTDTQQLESYVSSTVEPPRVCRRPFGLSHAAIAGSSSMA